MKNIPQKTSIDSRKIAKLLALRESLKMVLKPSVIESLFSDLEAWRAKAENAEKLLKKSESSRDEELRAYELTVSNLRKKLKAA